MPKKPVPAMKLADWPEKDRELWIEAQKPTRLFDDARRASTWRPATICSVEMGYGVYLSWLEQNGSLHQVMSPAARVDEDRIAAFIEDYAPGRAETSVAGAVRGIAYMMRATVPQDGLPWLTKLAHKLTNTAKPSRPKLPRMASIPELMELSKRLTAEGQHLLAEGKVEGARLYRDGLMIASLVSRPLRRRNFAALCIGSTLLVESRGLRVTFSKEQTKKGMQIDFYYPEWIVEPFVFYLYDVRPVLLRRSTSEDEGWVWIGSRGEPLSENMISMRIGDLTHKHLGRRVSPHLFRDISATSIALHDPGHVGITKEVLGHATLASSQDYYNQAESFVAVNRHQAVLDNIRRGKG